MTREYRRTQNHWDGSGVRKRRGGFKIMQEMAKSTRAGQGDVPGSKPWGRYRGVK